MSDDSPRWAGIPHSEGFPPTPSVGTVLPASLGVSRPKTFLLERGLVIQVGFEKISLSFSQPIFLPHRDLDHESRPLAVLRTPVSGSGIRLALRHHEHSPDRE
jgi:hypothetical protein